MAQNFFGVTIPMLGDILRDPLIKRQVRNHLKVICNGLEVSSPLTSKFINDCIYSAGADRIYDFERKTFTWLKQKGDFSNIDRHSRERAHTINEQLKPYLSTDTPTLDIGCGNGMVGATLRDNEIPLVLTDINSTPSSRVIGNLEFRAMADAYTLPADDSEFDVALLITTLHHSPDPTRLIDETRRVVRTGGRVLAIESVYGVDATGMDGQAQKESMGYLALNLQQQLGFSAFFDLFCNRIYHYHEDPSNKVSVPFNFNTPSGWKSVFKEHGLTTFRTIPLGIDHQLFPEFHMLYVLDKR